MMNRVTKFIDQILGSALVEDEYIDIHLDMVNGRGHITSTIWFVGASPSELDKVRKKAFSGNIGVVMRDIYLKSLRVTENDVYMTNIVPFFLSDDDGPRDPTGDEINDWVDTVKGQIDKYNPTVVIALGKVAKEALGDHATTWFPHPRAVDLYGDTGEVARKSASVLKRLEEAVVEATPQREFEVHKADEELRVAYGVVIEPEVEDTDGNWTSEEEILKAAHYYMMNSQVVGVEHVFLAKDTHVVESYVSPVDFEINGHQVKKGTWVMAVKVDDDVLWSEIKKGGKTGFSFGGTANIDPSKRLSQ